MISVKKPTYVKKANMWLVTIVTKDKDKEIFTREWFNSEDKANKYYLEKINKV